MPTPPIEEIRLGPINVRFFIDGTAVPDGSISMFDFTVAPGAKVPIAHSHDAYEETCYALLPSGPLPVNPHVSTPHPAT
jgi:quercetin dioxygenase-like cupin family protein